MSSLYSRFIYILILVIAHWNKPPMENQTCIQKTVNISKFLKDEIIAYTTQKSLEIISFDLSSEIILRFGKTSPMTNITLKLKETDGNILLLDDLNECTTPITMELARLIRAKENEAINNLSKFVENGQPTPVKGETIKLEEGKRKKYGDVRLTLCMCSTVEDMKSFLTRPERIAFWAGGSATFGNNQVCFENVILKDIKASQSQVSMEYKWTDWEGFSRVGITFEKVADNVKVSLVQKDVPVELVDNVRSHWRNRIFEAISQVFRCAIKSDY